MFYLLKEYLRAKINCPIITKHTTFCLCGVSVHEDGVTYLILTARSIELFSLLGIPDGSHRMY